MSIAAHLLLAVATATAVPADAPRMMATAQVSVELVRPAIVRQGEADAETRLRAKRSERDGRILFEFQ